MQCYYIFFSYIFKVNWYLNLLTLFIGFTPSRPKRLRKEPHHLNNYFVTTTTRAETEQISTFNDDIKNIWKVKYFNILDAIIINMKKRFSPESLQMAKAIDSFIKRIFDDSSFFVDNYKVTIN